jgi:hypothetical protein
MPVNPGAANYQSVLALSLLKEKPMELRRCPIFGKIIVNPR